MDAFIFELLEQNDDRHAIPSLFKPFILQLDSNSLLYVKDRNMNVV
jgi:hypothetical protein